MKLIIFLVLFSPSLIWGLTFKDGKQITTDQEIILPKEKQIEKKYEYHISKPGLIFITKENFDQNILDGDSSKCSFQSLAKPAIYKSTHDTLNTIGERSILYYCNEIKKSKTNTNILEESINSDLLKELDSLIDNSVPQSSLKNYFLELESSNFFDKLPFNSDDSGVPYELGRFIPSLLFTYSIIKNDFTLVEQEKILIMFKKMILRNKYIWIDQQVGPNASNNNQGLYFTNLALLTAILLGDDALFNSSIKKFKSIMHYNTSESGFMKIDGKRHQCSLHYNLHGLVPTLSILWNLKIQGYDLTKDKLTKNHNIDEIVSAILNIALNPKELKDFHKKYGLSRGPAGKSCMGWMSKKEIDQFYNKEINIIMPYHSSGWIYLYDKLSDNQNNIESFYKSEFLTSEFSLNRNPPGLGDNNAIGALPHLIFK